MTTKKDNFIERVNKLGTGLEETIGIPEDAKTQRVSFQKETITLVLD